MVELPISGVSLLITRPPQPSQKEAFTSFLFAQMLLVSNSSVLSTVVYKHFFLLTQWCSFVNCVTLVRDDEEFSFAIKAQKKRNLWTGNLNANGPLLADGSIIEAVHACPHHGASIFPFPLSGVRMRSSNSRGCGCLIPSSPCLPFGLIGLHPSFPDLLLPLAT